MISLILISLAAALLYLSNQFQQILAKPISLPFAIVAAMVIAGYGVIKLYQQYALTLALLQCIAMVSFVFMILPVFSGLYASKGINQSWLLKNDEAKLRE